jgi:ribonuclease P/MRP protein subunit POP5
MKLMPSLKQRKRYILFEIKSDKSFSLSDIKEEVDKALLLFLGQLGLSKAIPQFVHEKSGRNKFVLKCNNKYVDEVKSAIILIKSIKNNQIILNSVITSGTLKKISSYLK